MSRRIFFSTILWLILVNLIIKAIFIFGIDMQVQNQVGQTDYGLYFTLLNLCYIFQIINDFGLNLLHNTDTAVHGKIRADRWWQILRLKFILALFYSLTVAIVAFILGYHDVWKLLIWLVVNNILVSFILVLRAGISGMGKYTLEAFVSVMDKALMILICGFLLVSLSDFRIEWFIWAQTVSLIVTAVFAMLVSLRLIDRTKSPVTSTPMEVIFKNTLPFTLGSLLMFIYTRSDSIMIEKLLSGGSFQVGVYAAGYRLLDAANMLAYLFSPLLIPMYARLMNDRNETVQLLRLSGGLMICISFFISLAGYWWGAEIMHMLYRGVDDQWILTFRLLILSHIPIGLMYVFGSYLTATSQMKKQNILFIFSVFISLGMNLIMIPKYGTVGAAITAVITQSFTTIGLILLVHGHLKGKPDYRRLFDIFIFCVILAFSGWILSSTPFHWMIEITMFFVVCGVAALTFRLIEWRNFRMMIQSSD